MIDFGFAKKFPFEKNGVRQDKTYTLCGTPEYLGEMDAYAVVIVIAMCCVLLLSRSAARRSE
jgi:hypothetical protein